MTIDQIIQNALLEDIGNGDHTSLATVPYASTGKARLLVKEFGVIAGVEIARKIFYAVDQSIEMKVFISDGQEVNFGDIIFEVSGPSVSLLTAERTVLNFMQRMSGIATETRKMVNAIRGYKTRLLDTRKTTPLLREIEKQAVVIGGGVNHRFGLFDMILIKDNHIDFSGGITLSIRQVHEYLQNNDLKLPIEIEVRNLYELEEVLLAGGVDRVMLDNFSYDDLRKAVDMIGGRFETEASGGINFFTIEEYAKCGVDFISVGALTHHIKSLDLSLKAI